MFPRLPHISVRCHQWLPVGGPGKCEDRRLFGWGHSLPSSSAAQHISTTVRNSLTSLRIWRWWCNLFKWSLIHMWWTDSMGPSQLLVRVRTFWLPSGETRAQFNGGHVTVRGQDRNIALSGHKERATSPTLFTRNWCEHPQTTFKAESQHFNLIVIISFHTHCAGVQSQNSEKCVAVLLRTDCTLLGKCWRSIS